MTQTTGEAGGGAPAGGAPASGAPAAAAQAAWTDSIQDADLREFAVNKGYNKAAVHEVAPTILQQYRNLEKLVGAEKAGNTVVLPNWDSTEPAALAAQNEYFDRIGRPKEAKEYDLAAPQGAKLNEKIENWSRDTFHKAGLSTRQATAISKAYQELEAAQATEQQQADLVRFSNEDKSLKTEWGAAYNDKIAKASAVAKNLGLKPENIDALQSVAGYGEVMKMFANLADKVGEHHHVNPEQNSGTSVMTPSEAKAELGRLSRDKDWMAAFMDKAHPNHKAALERKAFLTGLEVAGA
jgi:hypothetical protein